MLRTKLSYSFTSEPRTSNHFLLVSPFACFKSILHFIICLNLFISLIWSLLSVSIIHWRFSHSHPLLLWAITPDHPPFASLHEQQNKPSPTCNLKTGWLHSIHNHTTEMFPLYKKLFLIEYCCLSRTAIIHPIQTSEYCAYHEYSNKNENLLEWKVLIINLFKITAKCFSKIVSALFWVINFFKKLFIDISIYFQLFYVSDLAVAHDIFMK